MSQNLIMEDNMTEQELKDTAISIAFSYTFFTL